MVLRFLNMQKEKEKRKRQKKKEKEGVRKLNAVAITHDIPFFGRKVFEVLTANLLTAIL